MKHPDGAKIEFNRRVGAAIRSAREAEGYTQAEVARAISVSGSTLSHIEDGILACPLFTLARLAEHFDVTLDALVPVDAGVDA